MVFVFGAIFFLCLKASVTNNFFTDNFESNEKNNQLMNDYAQSNGGEKPWTNVFSSDFNKPHWFVLGKYGKDGTQGVKLQTQLNRSPLAFIGTPNNALFLIILLT